MSLVRKGLAILALVLPVAALAAPGAGLNGTAHDFTAGVTITPTGGGAAVTTANTQAIGLCTYCHTPHQAISQSLLWNHTLSANNFTWNAGETTAAGTVYPTIAKTFAGPTVKCLSCHDGSVAVGDINWFNDAKLTGTNANNAAVVNGTHQIATATGGMNGNHPVAMPYPFNQAASTYNGQALGANATLTEFQANPTTLTTTAGAGKIKLYSQAGTVVTGVPAAGTTGLECSSCHDPHNKQTSDDMFLRGTLTGNTQASGYICLQCHIK